MNFLGRTRFGVLALLALPTSLAHAQLPHLYSFGAGHLVDPADVAVWTGSSGLPNYTFVADSGSHQVLRFAQAGQTGAAPLVFPFGGFLDGPTGIAVNGIVGHCNVGQVYVVDQDATAGNGYLYVFQANGSLLLQVGLSSGSGFKNPLGVAVGRDGDVYVADRGVGMPDPGRVYRFAASTFGPPHNLSILATPTQVYSSTPFGPAQDVSVDVGGRVHVVNDCGCFKVFEPWGTLLTFPGGGIPILERVGVDALDIKARTWTSGNGLRRQDWDWNDYDDAPETFVQSGFLGQTRGVESAKFGRWTVGSSSGTLATRWEERLFVCDSSDDQIEVFGQDTLSAPHPLNAVAWWRFEEQQSQCGNPLQLVRDEFGVHHGVPSSGSLQATTEGVVRNGFDASRGPSAVVVPDHAQLDFGTGSFSVEGWIMTRQTSGNASFLDKRDGLGQGFLLFTRHGHLGLQLNLDGITYENYTPQVPENFVADGTWKHFAVVCDRPGTGVSFFVDGIKVPGVIPALGANISNSEPLYIGAGNPGSGDTPFAGYLDELALYERALDALEIAGIVAAESAGKELPAQAPIAYCTAGTSTSGCNATLYWTGTPSVSAGSGFTISAANVEGMKLGLFFYGVNGPAASPWGAGSSFLCVKAPTQRLGVMNSVGTTGQCDGVLSIDFNVFLANHPTALGQPFVGGESICVQAWYRDPPASKNTNLSNGLEFTLSP